MCIYSIRKHAILALCAVINVCILGGCALVSNEEETLLSPSKDLFFVKSDSIKAFLDTYDPQNLSESAQMEWQLWSEYLAVRKNKPYSPDSVMPNIVDFFQQKGDHINLCRALFIQGEMYFNTQQYYKAIAVYKRAESQIPYLNELDPIIGMIYYWLGKTADYESLYSVAYDYYQMAEPYLKKMNSDLYLLYCYMDQARTANDLLPLSVQDSLYSLALDQARQQKRKAREYEIIVQRAINMPNTDTASLIVPINYLYKHSHLTCYLDILVEYYTNHDSIAQAYKYLAPYAEDTTLYGWSKEQYHTVYGKLLAHQGRHAEAFHHLQYVQDLHNQQIIEDNHNRAYTIAQRYDWEQERERALQLTIQKQHLWIVIGGISLLSVILILCIWIIVRNHRHKLSQMEMSMEQERIKAEAEQKLMEAQSEHLEQELALKRQNLKKLLAQRVQFTKRVCALPEGKKEQFPQWLQTFIQDFSVESQESWLDFQREFNDLYNNILTRLQEKYPKLTSTDLQYIALFILGFDIPDISTLLRMNPQTISNRRQRIKAHIGIPNLNLDEFIEEWKTKQA